MKQGDMVMIYQDVLTEHIEEGWAELISLDPDDNKLTESESWLDGDGNLRSIESWFVLFISDGYAALRSIKVTVPKPSPTVEEILDRLDEIYPSNGDRSKYEIDFHDRRIYSPKTRIKLWRFFPPDRAISRDVDSLTDLMNWLDNREILFRKFNYKGETNNGKN